ncbi:MAG: methyltransferase domain-containing protein [Gaiellaceae bacterium]
MDPDEYRRASLQNWNTVAAGWERRRANIEKTSTPVREWLVRELAPQPGATILELASGPGDTGFATAALLGEEGRLITTDFSPEMVEVARRRGAELGLRNVEYRTMDAERLDLADDSVDGVICRFAYMLMADPAAALVETRRILRRGGRLVFAVWRGAEQNPWVSIAGRVLVGRGLMAPPEPGVPGMFTMAPDERVHSLLTAAGFTHVRIDDVPVRFVYSGIDDYVASARDTGGAFSTAFGQASEEEREAITREFVEAFAPFALEGGYEFPGLALVAVAS